LTPLDLHYLARIFLVVQQKLRDYILAFPELLSYVTMTIVYVESMTNASKHIDYHHMYEEILTFVSNIKSSVNLYTILTSMKRS